MSSRDTLKRSLGWAAIVATILVAIVTLRGGPGPPNHPGPAHDVSGSSVTPVPASPVAAPHASDRVTASDPSELAGRPGIPAKVYEVFEKIRARDGEPIPGYVGGRSFENRERRLPRGRYREYDVNPKIRGQDRGAERLVIEQRTGKAYYTEDHYRSFTAIN